MRSQREARSAASTAAMAALRAAAGKLRPRKAASRAASTKYMYTIIMLRREHGSNPVNAGLRPGVQ